MDRTKLGSGIVLVVLVAWFVGTLITLASSNDLFLGSDWQLAAGATLGVFVVGILVYIALAFPWRFPSTTTYW